MQQTFGQEVWAKTRSLAISRKFWAGIVSILVAFGALENSGIEETALIEALVTVGVGASYILGTAIEDINKR